MNAARGIAWSQSFHPDEAKIARWMKQVREGGYIRDRVYPGGFFVLAMAGEALTKPFGGLGTECGKAIRQDGPVVATDAASFVPTPRPHRVPSDIVQMGRNLNVALFALATLFVFLAGLDLGAGCISSFAAALLFAVQPLPLEFAHYCETDLAMLATLSLAIWLSIRALRFSSAGLFLAASFATGFAIACKYSIAPLALGIPAQAAALVPRESGRRGAAIARLAALGLAALFAGFLAGTPALLLAPGFFLRNLGGTSRATWAEADRALGPARTYGASCAWRAAAFGREIARFGVASIALFAAGVATWFRRRGRLLLATVPLFLAAYTLHAAFTMPWIRRQEILPLLPPLCLGTAPLLAWAGRRIRRGVPLSRLAAPVSLIVLFAGGLLHTAASGNRVLTGFQRRDTRAECQNRLAASARPGLSLAVEPYVSQCIRGTGCRGIFRRQIASQWPSLAEDKRADAAGVGYVLRNASFSGRRELRPDAEERRRLFASACVPLIAWRIAPGGARPETFSQPDVELWAVGDPSDSLADRDIPLCLDRPVFFTPGIRHFYAPDELSPSIGPVQAVPTAGVRHIVHPPSSGSPCWAIAQILDGPVAGSVKWDGLFRPRNKSFSGSGVAVFRLDGRSFRRAASWDIRPGASLRLRGADDQSTLCATRLCTDAAEAARALRRAGAPEEALALLREAGHLDMAARTEAFLAAASAGIPPESQWTEAARSALAAVDAAMDAGLSPDTKIRGVPIRVLQDFPFVRIADREGPPVPGVLPVLLPAGRYGVRVTPRDPANAGFLRFKGQEGPLREESGEEGEPVFVATIVMSRPGLLRAIVENGVATEFRRIEVQWDPSEQISRASDELRSALADTVP